MNIEHIINTWRSEKGQQSLTAAEQALLPENPVIAFDLVEAELAEVVGGEKTAFALPQSGSCAFSLIFCC